MHEAKTKNNTASTARIADAQGCQRGDADLCSEERRASAIARADAAKAFDIADKMSDKILELESAAAALRIIAESSDIENIVSSALHGLANTIERTARKLDTVHGKIFGLTWAYKMGYVTTQRNL